MFGRKGLFEQKKSPIEESRRGNFAPGSRVFDASLFDGETGDFLRSAGFAPDDPINRLDLQEPVSAQLARDKAELRRVLGVLNDASPDPLGAFTLLREETWHGRVGNFLMRRLDLSPFRPWNVIFLPLDSTGAEKWGLPVGTVGHENIAENEEVIQMIAELFSNKPSPEANAIAILCDAVADKFTDLFPPEIKDFSPAVRTARRRVRAFAFQRGMLGRFDQQVIMKSQQTFLHKPDIQLVA